MNHLKKKCNELWILACLAKWGNVCECCGATAETYHHFIPKSLSNNLRYNPLNGVPLCSRYGNKCHYKIHFSRDPLVRRDLEDRIILKRGKDWLAYIDRERKVRVRVRKSWYEGIINELEK